MAENEEDSLSSPEVEGTMGQGRREKKEKKEKNVSWFEKSKALKKGARRPCLKRDQNTDMASLLLPLLLLRLLHKFEPAKADFFSFSLSLFLSRLHFKQLSEA